MRRRPRAQPYVLVVGNRWHQWNQALLNGGVDQNTVGTLSAVHRGPWDVWHPDADVIRSGQSVEASAERLVAYVSVRRPDLIVVVRLPWEDASWWTWLQVVSTACRRGDIPVLTLWHDLVTDGDIALAERIATWVDGQIQIDRHLPPPGVRDPGGYLPLWTVHDPRLFHTGQWARPWPLTCPGDWDQPVRQRILRCLEHHHLSYRRVGGQHSMVSLSEYAAVCRQSQMMVNTNNHPTRAQIKGHVFAALSCGALLLEQHYDSGGTQELLVPHVEYVPYTTDDELVEHVQYYQRHPARLRAVAACGARAYLERYSPRHFWTRICQYVWGHAWI